MTAVNRRLLGIMLLVLLGIMALGARGLDSDPLWIDELYSVGNIGAVYRVPFTPAQVWESVQVNSPQHTPGYFFLLSGWAALAGWTPFALRALSLLFGLLAAAWTYRLGYDWVSPHAGVYAAAALGIGAFFINFTHEIRMYTLIAALTAFVLWLYLRLVNPVHHPTRVEWSLWFVGALGLLYSHIIGAIPLAALSLYHLLFVPKNRRWWLVVGLLALVGLLFLPWLNVLLGGAKYGSREDIALSPSEIIQATLYWFSSSGILLFFGLLGLALAALRTERPARTLWFLAGAMLLLTIVVNEVTHIITPNRPRYLITLWPVLAALVGLGLTVIERYRRGLALALLAVWLAFGLGSTLDPAFLLSMDGPRHVVEFPPLKKIVAEINQLAEPEDFLITFAQHPHVFERFKFVSTGEFHFHDLHVGSLGITLPDPRSPDVIRQAVRDAIGQRLTVWFAYEPEIAPETLQIYRDALAETYLLCQTALADADLRIERYDYAAFGCLDEPSETPRLTYREGITLADLRAQPGTDGVLRVAAGWRVSDVVPANTYSVSLKLWPAAGEFVAQADYGLRPAGFGWQLAELPIQRLPPGDYTLTLTVYDWSRGPRLIATDAEGNQGEELPVIQVTIPTKASSDVQTTRP